MSRSIFYRPDCASAIGAALACSAWVSAATAQTTEKPVTTKPATADQLQGAAGVEEVVVTATRRAEPLQKVPIAITVVDAEVLREENRTSVQSIAAIVPSLNFRTVASPSGEALFIRGLGTVSTSSGVEPTVSTMIDGVVIARQGQATMDLLDINHIEVLRGPQGTLFGKNASVGALNVVTNTPGNTPHAFVDVGYYGGGNETTARGAVSGPIVKDKLAASLTAAYSHYDGNVTNVYDNSTVNGWDNKGVRGKLVATPIESLNSTTIVDYSQDNNTSPQGIVTRTYLTAFPTNVVTSFPAFAAALAPDVASATSRTINSSYFSHSLSKNDGVSEQLDWTKNEYVLTSISAWRGWKNTQFQDQDRLPAPSTAYPYQHDVGVINFNQYSEELRLASPKHGFFDYQVGLFYFQGVDSEVYRRDTTLVTTNVQSVVTGIANYGVTNTSYAGFGEGNLHFTDHLRATAGLRVTHDEVDYNFNRVSTSAKAVAGIQTSFAAAGDTDATGYSSRLGLQYDVNKSLMTYASYGRGYKGPAYNLAFSMLPQDIGVVKPEISDAYEVGVKSRLFGGAVLFNAAVFLDMFKDYQVNFYDTYNGSPVTRLINAGRVSTRGGEFDLSTKPARNLTLTASGAYTDAHIDSFTCPVGTSASCQINGMPLPYAPKWKGNVRASYELPVSDSMSVRATTDVNAQSQVQYSINQTPDTIQPAYGIWNASLGLVARSHWEVNLVVKNILNQSYAANLATFGQGIVRWAPRDDTRYFGFNAHYGF